MTGKERLKKCRWQGKSPGVTLTGTEEILVHFPSGIWGKQRAILNRTEE